MARAGTIRRVASRPIVINSDDKEETEDAVLEDEPEVPVLKSQHAENNDH